MKDMLRYFYQIVISNNDINTLGYFFYHNRLFCIQKYARSKDEAYSLLILNNYMLNNNIKINRIILNINNEILTYYNDEYYILIKVDYQKLSINNFSMIKAPNIKELDNLKRNNWDYLWSIKVDYIEYQMEHLKNKYPLLYDTYNYYVGLTENAIMYFKMLNVNNVSLYINHRRLREEQDFFNPIDLIIDYEIRDICEYLKDSFFKRKMTNLDIINYLKRINLQDIDYILLYIRFLYPSYYFDLYDKIVNEKENEKKIENIIKLVDDYEILLKDIAIFIKTKVNLIEINWLS